MLEIVQATVWKLWWAHHEILVGDAVGIDAAVVKWAEKLGVKYMAYGVTPNARNKAQNYLNVHDQLPEYVQDNTRWGLKFIYRDRWMVDQADMVICISNIPITSGTKKVYQYAGKLQKPALLRTKLNEAKMLTN